MPAWLHVDSQNRFNIHHKLIPRASYVELAFVTLANININQKTVPGCFPILPSIVDRCLNDPTSHLGPQEFPKPFKFDWWLHVFVDLRCFQDEVHLRGSIRRHHGSMISSYNIALTSIINKFQALPRLSSLLSPQRTSASTKHQYQYAFPS